MFRFDIRFLVILLTHTEAQHGFEVTPSVSHLKTHFDPEDVLRNCLTVQRKLGKIISGT